MSLLVLTAGRVALSADFEDSAIVHAPELPGAVASCCHCPLEVVDADGRLEKRGIGAVSAVGVA
jgi:hypothetical protein